MNYLFSSFWIQFFVIISLSAQAQTFRGNVTYDNEIPLESVLVILSVQDTLKYSTNTDRNGNFFFNDVPFGTVTLDLSKKGFSTLFIATLFTLQNRDVYRLKMEKKFNVLLDSLTISASPQLAEYDGNIHMSRSQYKIMAASFQDPSRVLLHYPGFITDNDGTNAFSFRGIPGYTSYWQIFDAEIVNPNHLITAGNRGDAISVNSGGVNTISSSIIGNYTFNTNTSSISLGNITNGASNVELASHLKNYLDVSLIGLETGVCKKFGDKHTYGTARYSFVGLLEKLGVPFGNESINYQDVSLVSELVKTKNMALKGFVIFGQSRNDHKALEADVEKKTIKDFKNISYESQLVILGMHSHIRMKDNQFFHLTINYSARKDNHIESLDTLYRQQFNSPDIIRKEQAGMLSGHFHHFFFSGKHALKSGVRFTFLHQPIKEIASDDQLNHSRLYPYFDYQFTLKHWKWDAGLGVNSIFNNRNGNRYQINYFGALERNLWKNTYIRLNHRFSDQFLANHFDPERFIHLKTLASELAIGKKSKKFSWRLGAFYYDIWDNNAYIPENGQLISTFNGLDFGADHLTFENPSQNKASVSGFDAMWVSSFARKRSLFEIIANLAYTKSLFTQESEEMVPAKYDIGFSGGLASYLTLQGIKNEWNFGMNLHFREGIREYVNYGQPLADEWQTLYNTSGGLLWKQNPYSRLDIRVVFTKKNNNNRQHRFSLDIQNVLNQQNSGFTYFDAYLQKTHSLNQLGLIPVLGYRFEF